MTRILAFFGAHNSKNSRRTLGDDLYFRAFRVEASNFWQASAIAASTDFSSNSITS